MKSFKEELELIFTISFVLSYVKVFPSSLILLRRELYVGYTNLVDSILLSGSGLNLYISYF